MSPHTFPDVMTNNGPESVKVSLPYPYQDVDPSTTRLFFEGEVVIINPETSPFESYVTHPLLPCLFGRILDTATGKSLVFHKYATHNMETLLPSLDELSPSRSENLDVTLYSCELSPQQFQRHRNSYGGKSQVGEMNAVRNFLRDQVGIPEDQIERRFFRNRQHLALPNLGQYEHTPLTIGVSKNGDVFHTSPFNQDLLGLGSLSLPQEFQEKDWPSTIEELPHALKIRLEMETKNLINPIIRETFVIEDINNRMDGSKSFFSAPILDVPSSSLSEFFNMHMTIDRNKIITSMLKVSVENPFLE